MKYTAAIQTLGFPNFIRVTGLPKDGSVIDVGALFPSDEAAGQYWDECKVEWLKHVESRRKAAVAELAKAVA